MPFTVADFQDLLRLLEQHPEWKSALRAALLGDELLQLPALVRELAEAQRRTEEELRRLAEAQSHTGERVGHLEQTVAQLVQAQQRTDEQLAALTEAQRRTDQRLAELAEAQRRTDEQLAALTEAQRHTDERLAALTEEVRSLTRTLGRMEERWGLAHEQIAEDLLPEMLRRKGWEVLRVGRLDFDGEVDLLVAVRVQDRVFTVAAEVKGRVWSRAPADEVLRKIQRPAFLEALRRQGFPEPAVPAVFGILVYTGAEEAARQAGVGLFTPRDGELVPPSVP